MHFFYLDESGCTGRDLTASQQPVFVSGGIVVRDEGWNETHKKFSRVISDYFGGNVPQDFEFHTEELFSPNGHGFFLNNERERRNSLIHSLLDMLVERKHQIFYCAVDKKKVSESQVAQIRSKPYLADFRVPYLLAYDYLVSTIENYTKEKLGRSARALLIIDKKAEFQTSIEAITDTRRFRVSDIKRIKWIAEFSYPIDSEKNIMIQMSDMCIFLIRKFLEVENGYKESLPYEVKEIFREFYRKIHDRLIVKTVQEEEGRHSEEYNNFLHSVLLFPTVRWKTRNYRQ